MATEDNDKILLIDKIYKFELISSVMDALDYYMSLKQGIFHRSHYSFAKKIKTTLTAKANNPHETIFTILLYLKKEVDTLIFLDSKILLTLLSNAIYEPLKIKLPQVFDSDMKKRFEPFVFFSESMTLFIKYSTLIYAATFLVIAAILIPQGAFVVATLILIASTFVYSVVMTAITCFIIFPHRHTISHSKNPVKTLIGDIAEEITSEIHKDIFRGIFDPNKTIDNDEWQQICGEFSLLLDTDVDDAILRVNIGDFLRTTFNLSHNLDEVITQKIKAFTDSIPITQDTTDTDKALKKYLDTEIDAFIIPSENNESALSLYKVFKEIFKLKTNESVYNNQSLVGRSAIAAVLGRSTDMLDSPRETRWYPTLLRVLRLNTHPAHQEDILARYSPKAAL